MESEIIEKYFKRPITDPSVIAGIGDDAALLRIPDQYQLVVTTDSLIADIHFPQNTQAFDIGFKSAAVNLSDLAAMGAIPKWISLALVMPTHHHDWLASFTKGLFQLLDQFNVSLIGGDLCCGPHLMITITAQGLVETDKALRRNAAKVGDIIYVTHALGDAGLALRCLQHNQPMADAVAERFYRPQPEIAAGRFLRHYAHAAIDLSDGLATDLPHVLQQSRVGANVELTALPLSPYLQALALEDAWHLALTAGDDYALCFTAPANQAVVIQKGLPMAQKIGVITAGSALTFTRDGEPFDYLPQGYQHFKD